MIDFFIYFANEYNISTDISPLFLYIKMPVTNIYIYIKKSYVQTCRKIKIIDSLRFENHGIIGPTHYLSKIREIWTRIKKKIANIWNHKFIYFSWTRCSNKSTTYTTVNIRSFISTHTRELKGKKII
jgi:hypothetical protein